MFFKVCSNIPSDMTNPQPIKLSHKYGKSSNVKYITTIIVCVIKAAIKVAFDFTNFTKKANRNMPNTFP